MQESEEGTWCGGPGVAGGANREIQFCFRVFARALHFSLAWSVARPAENVTHAPTGETRKSLRWHLQKTFGSGTFGVGVNKHGASMEAPCRECLHT